MHAIAVAYARQTGFKSRGVIIRAFWLGAVVSIGSNGKIMAAIKAKVEWKSRTVAKRYVWGHTSGTYGKYFNAKGQERRTTYRAFLNK